MEDQKCLSECVCLVLTLQQRGTGELNVCVCGKICLCVAVLQVTQCVWVERFLRVCGAVLQVANVCVCGKICCKAWTFI